jgi:putative ABC transport system ATP-binding protein
VSVAASVEGAVALAASAPVAAAPALTVVPPLEVPPVEEAPVLDAPDLDVPPLVELAVEPPAVDLPGLEVPEALVEALPSVTLPVPPPEAPWSADAPAPTVPDFLVVDLPAAPDESADQTLHVVAAPPDHAPLSGTITAPAPTPTPASSPLRPPLPASARSVAAARAIAKRVGRGASARELFRSVTLDLAEGEFLGVVGPSGAGKSMLLSCLSGLVRPDAGDVLIDGTPVTALTESDRALQRVGTMGFATSTPGLVGVLTAQENVELPLQIAGWSRSDASKEATAALTLLRVEDLADALPDTLSGGERVKVTLARALVGEPKIVWADEPTAGLDPGSADDVAHVLRQLNEDGLAVVVVTHDPRLLQHAHRIVELRDGAVREASRRKVLDECRRPFR